MQCNVLGIVIIVSTSLFGIWLWLSGTDDVRGLSIEYDPQRDTETLKDIPMVKLVFVHGIEGTAKGTWTHPKSEEFWPLWLNETPGLENAQIITFGYDSRWTNIFMPLNYLGISEFSDQLLDGLDSHYRRYGDVGILSWLAF